MNIEISTNKNDESSDSSTATTPIVAFKSSTTERVGLTDKFLFRNVLFLSCGIGEKSTVENYILHLVNTLCFNKSISPGDIIFNQREHYFNGSRLNSGKYSVYFTNEGIANAFRKLNLDGSPRTEVVENLDFANLGIDFAKFDDDVIEETYENTQVNDTQDEAWEEKPTTMAKSWAEDAEENQQIIELGPLVVLHSIKLDYSQRKNYHKNLIKKHGKDNEESDFSKVPNEIIPDFSEYVFTYPDETLYDPAKLVATHVDKRVSIESLEKYISKFCKKRKYNEPGVTVKSYDCGNVQYVTAFFKTKEECCVAKAFITRFSINSIEVEFKQMIKSSNRPPARPKSKTHIGGFVNDDKEVRDFYKSSSSNSLSTITSSSTPAPTTQNKTPLYSPEHSPIRSKSSTELNTLTHSSATPTSPERTTVATNQKYKNTRSLREPSRSKNDQNYRQTTNKSHSVYDKQYDKNEKTKLSSDEWTEVKRK